MNNGETKTEATLRFRFVVEDYALAPFTHLKLFNGYNEIVHEGFGNMDKLVSRGLYQLRIEINEHVEDRHYRVTEDVNDSLRSVKAVSSMPVQGLTSTHEYFSQPAQEWSLKSTRTKESLFGSSLFIFLRYADAKQPFAATGRQVNDFILLNAEREEIKRLDSSNTIKYNGRHEEYFGGVIFNDRFEPGQYYVIYKSRKLTREIPVYIFPDWQTQLFLAVKDVPQFNSLRISIGHGFIWDSKQNRQLDALIQKMFNGIYFLPEQLKNAAADGKWENPMLGILAAYMYLLTDKTEDDKLFSVILDNLESRILRDRVAPDLVALKLLAAIHYKKEIPTTNLSAPCMVAAGLLNFLKQSYTNEGLIRNGSIVEKVFSQLYSDSIWTTYTPLPVKRKTAGSALEKGIQIANEVIVEYSTMKTRGVSEKEFKFDLKKDWITTSVFNLLAESKVPLAQNEVAAQLQVPGNLIKNVFNTLNNTKNIEVIANAILGKEVNKEDIDKKIGNVGKCIKYLK